jgi:hypothetical protein
VIDESDDTILASDVSARTAAELMGGVTAKFLSDHVARYGSLGVNELLATATEESP